MTSHLVNNPYILWTLQGLDIIVIKVLISNGLGTLCWLFSFQLNFLAWLKVGLIEHCKQANMQFWAFHACYHVYICKAWWEIMMSLHGRAYSSHWIVWIWSFFLFQCVVSWLNPRFASFLEGLVPTFATAIYFLTLKVIPLK